ncbi:MAG: Male sterility-like protein [Parcubacteria group bacterium GW2011_GWA2_47_7]|nr:MAG: Male sterility-like protein [Parcubacteria group bacterium GW2011_GWA2_47_7]
MRVLLTGATGNLGSEVAIDLKRRGIEVIPIVRPGKRKFVAQFESIVESDLTAEGRIEFGGTAEAIVHCAGDVRFRKVERANERMMRKVLHLAESLKAPLFFASTAFVYKPRGSNIDFNNSYEEDKYHAEQVLSAARIPYAILRPSVLTGNSRTGRILNFSGYYSLVRAFLNAVRGSVAKNRKLRFPRMTGTSDMVPVDEAAIQFGDAVQNERLATVYVTNPAPPQSQWVLDETLDFFGLRNKVAIIDMPFDEYGKLGLTEEERALFNFASHFAPYWSIDYRFPSSACTRNLIDRDYVTRILTFFRDSGHPTLAYAQ